MHRRHSTAVRMAVDGADGIHFNTPGRGGGSGTLSPRLWSAKGASSPPPPSRLEAIERGQRELMEMVQSMPESAYELSLRDLVELPKPASAGGRPPEESAPAGAGRRWIGGGPPEMKQGRGTAMANGNGGDFMLRMFFPPTFGGSRSRSRKGRVLPEKYLDSGEWLKKSSSDHTNRNNRSRKLGGVVPSAGCWSFKRQ